jgi:hypothetical protein
VPILSVLTHARDAFVTGDLVRGRQFLAAELRRLETAKTGQNEVLDEWIGTPEQPGTSIDLSATA